MLFYQFLGLPANPSGVKNIRDKYLKYKYKYYRLKKLLENE